jgi:TolB-like protein
VTDRPTTQTRATAATGVAGAEVAITSSAAHTPLATGPERIGDRYEILGLLGMGGMGSVYRVRDRELDEVVALKFLRRELLQDPAMLDRFRQEVRLARRVTHGNVARTFDIGEHEGERFLTMEYVDGESLAKRLAREGPVSCGRAIEIALDLCAGLGAAHGAAVVHRDLKPDNVLLGKDGRVVITDFGIARAHTEGAGHTGGMIGTAAYMAPEQVEGRSDLDGRADLYALGALLFEAITGAPAWPGDFFVAVALARLREPPPDPRTRNPAVPDALAETILRCLARERDDRFASASELAEALRAAQQTLVAGESPALGLASVPARALRVAPAPVSGDRTIAVLPFASSQGDDAFLADALTDDLVDALSTTRGLRVRPRGLVAMYLTPGAADPRALGRALDVQVIVEGSVRRSGETVRIHARLVSVAEGFQLWGKRFDRPARDVLSINDEVARAVAGALTMDRASALRPAAADTETIELQLRARRALRDAWSGMGDLDAVVALFEQGLARAEGDPGLLSGVAMARARRLNYAAPDVDQVDAVRRAVDRALEVAPHLGEPWLALATLRYITSDWAGAVTAVRQALTRAPGLLQAHEMLGNIQLEIGAVDEGLFRLETVVSLDPTAANARFELARATALTGTWERADVLLALPVDTEEERIYRRFLRARLNLWRGVERHDTSGGTDSPTGRMAAAYAGVLATGTIDDGLLVQIERRLEQTREGSRLRPLVLQLAAELLGAAKRPEAALAYVARSVDAGLFDLTWMDRCPVLEDVRTLSDLAPLRARLVERAAPVLAALAAPLG